MGKKTADKENRNAIFTTDEKNLLVDLVLARKDVLENKKSDATTNVAKTKAWEELTDEFNVRCINIASIRFPAFLLKFIL